MEFLSMSAKQYREMLETKKSNKFHAVKTESAGVLFDSKKEANRFDELNMLQKTGKIQNLKRQIPFVLQAGFKNNQGKMIRPIIYIPDFCYIQDGVKIVEDVKSPATKTPVYKIKKKMFEYRYPEYKFVEF